MSQIGQEGLFRVLTQSSPLPDGRDRHPPVRASSSWGCVPGSHVLRDRRRREFVLVRAWDGPAEDRNGLPGHLFPNCGAPSRSPVVQALLAFRMWQPRPMIEHCLKGLSGTVRRDQRVFDQAVQ